MYIRKVKKAGKVYSYYYESKRIGGKVKSIYVGKALGTNLKKPARLGVVQDFKKQNNNQVTSLIEFDNLLNEINNLIIKKDLNNAIFTYNKMFDIYKNLDLIPHDKNRVFEKLNNIYDELVNLGKESKINLLE